MIDSIKMWSEAESKVVTWKVALVVDESIKVIDGLDRTQVLELRHKEEVFRYSPNTTDYELQRYAETANLAHGVGSSNREEAALAANGGQHG